MANMSIYQDISRRANGNIYMGIVGPVRTGKSTFIRRFMDVMVIPNMADPYEKTRVLDELPQSGEGKTITTTEPKFIPPEAVSVSTVGGAKCSVRMVDCVGYLIPGVLGHEEEGRERMVMTPWSDEKMAFTQAAEYGTEKVISDHSTVGIVITTDGTISELPRRNYTEAEEKTINQLKQLEKPFVVILNSASPQNKSTRELAENLEARYGVPVIPVNCQKITEEEFDSIFGKLMYQFPASEVEFRLPGYLEALPQNHWLKENLILSVRNWMNQFETIGDILETCRMIADGTFIHDVRIIRTEMGEGLVVLEPVLDDGLYYKVVEELMGTPVADDREMFLLLREYASAKRAYDNLKSALEQAETSDYGIVAPKLSEMILEKPEVFRQGGKYGVRMTAKAPCLHIVRTTISTEVSPVVGTESQSQDLANYLTEQFGNEETDIWETNLFGKSLREMVTEQMENKLNHVPEQLRGKVQRSLQRISDEGKDYFICIIL